MDGPVVFARWHQCDRHLIHDSLETTRLRIPNCISIRTAVFAPLTAQSPYTLKTERKSIYIAPFCTKVHTKRSGMDHTVLAANNTMPAFHPTNFTPFPFQSYPSRVGIRTPIEYVLPWAHPSPHPKGHLDRFGCLCRSQDRDKQTDRQTDRPRCSVCKNRPHLRSTAIRHKNKAIVDSRLRPGYAIEQRHLASNGATSKSLYRRLQDCVCIWSIM